MAKISVNEVTKGMSIKVKLHVNSDNTTALVAAHTKSATVATVTSIVPAGRYVFLKTDQGSIMAGRSGKVTIA